MSHAGRLGWIDLIRGGGAFLVVLAHVILYPELRGSGPLWAQSLYYSASRIAVPLFFMASGFLLLGRNESYGEFFRKRALRVFVPFLIWSLIYVAWYGGFSTEGLTLNSMGEALVRILRGPRASHLWFFYVLIGLYLITPILRIFTLHASTRDLWYFVGLWFALDPVLSLVKRTFGIQIGFEFALLTGYIGYFVLGHLLGKVELRRTALLVAGALSAVSFGVIFYTVYTGQQSAGYDQFFEGYLSVTVFALTGSAFLLTRALPLDAHGSALKAIRVLSGASLGIYLVHILVLDVMAVAAASALPALGSGSSLLLMPGAALVCYIVALLIVLALQRIPGLKIGVP